MCYYFLEIIFFAQNEKVIDSLKNEFRKTNNEIEMIAIQEKISHEYSIKGLISEGDKYLNTLISLEKTQKNKNLLGLIYKLKGNNFRHKNKLDSAKLMHKKGLAVIENIKQNKLAGDFYMNLGSIMRAQSQIDSAFYYFDKALDVYQTIKNYRGLTILNYNMASHYFNAGNYHKCSFHIERTIEFNKFYKSTYFEGLSFYMLGLLQTDIGSKKLAIENYKKAIDVAKSNNNYNKEVEYLMGLAVVYAKMGKTKEAKYVFEKALNIFNQYKLLVTWGYTYNLGNYIGVLIELEELDKAQEYIDKTFKLYSRYNFSFLRETIVIKQAKIYLDKRKLIKKLTVSLIKLI